MTRATAALIVLCAYGAALSAIALWGGRRTHNGNDFFLASRRLTAWFVAFSHVANASPVWLLLALSGAAFVWGLAAVWIWLAVIGYGVQLAVILLSQMPALTALPPAMEEERAAA